jgi:hypothetical protein
VRSPQKSHGERMAKKGEWQNGEKVFDEKISDWYARPTKISEPSCRWKVAS